MANGKPNEGRRKPTALKELEGTRRADREPVEPIQFEVISGDIPKAPIYFGKRAKEIWKSVLTQYKAVGMFSAQDLPSLQVYCKAVEDLEEIEEGLKNGTYERFFVTETAKFQQIHPIMSIRTKAIDDIKVYGAMLGLNPVARTKISGLIGDGKKEDKFGNFLKKKAN